MIFAQVLSMLKLDAYPPSVLHVSGQYVTLAANFDGALRLVVLSLPTLQPVADSDSLICNAFRTTFGDDVVVVTSVCQGLGHIASNMLWSLRDRAPLAVYVHRNKTPVFSLLYTNGALLSGAGETSKAGTVLVRLLPPPHVMFPSPDVTPENLMP
jgi:hypothetical protein